VLIRALAVREVTQRSGFPVLKCPALKKGTTTAAQVMMSSNPKDCLLLSQET
jgi:hypothetical protein